MARERVIVGIGEAVLCERGERIEAGGLAISIAAAAAALGKSGNTCCGFAVSRAGQDAAGDELLRQAQALGVDVTHIQTDPDLPTGRQVTRSIAGRTTSTLTSNAAFDNLQWDFDMIDLAQRADAVVFGQLARRGGQAKSVIKQFLLECRGSGGALRVFDLTNRGGDAIDRSEAWTGLEFCDVVVADETALKALAPTASAGADTDSVATAARELLRATSVQIVIAALRKGDCQRLRAISREESVEAGEPLAVAQHDATIMRLISGLLSGHDLSTSLRSVAATTG